MTFDEDIDARGLLCPLPVLKLRKRLKGLPPNSVVRLVSDDPAAIVDVPHFCTESGHRFLGSDKLHDGHAFYVAHKE